MLRIQDVYTGSRTQIFPSRIQDQKDPGSGSASKNSSIFNPKNCFLALGNMIWDVHSGFRIRIFLHSPGSGSRIQRSIKGKRHQIPEPDPQYWDGTCFLSFFVHSSVGKISRSFASRRYFLAMCTEPDTDFDLYRLDRICNRD